ncbi:MFS general substrate transporter [Panus rudis PR-1116 ss-1]|nr:MFS general substrate transporter [Panus rudis PR-1116 ss-1]
MSQGSGDELTLNEYHDEHDPVVIRRLEDVSDPVDPRITAPHRPTSDVLDEGYGRQLSQILSRESRPRDLSEAPSEPEPLYVDFEKDDPKNPINFSKSRKWTITVTACCFTAITAATASTYNMGWPSMLVDLNCTQFQATIGLALYCLGFGVVPLVTASFSEEFGRQPLYVCSTIGFALMHLMIALAQNIQTVQIARFLSGAFGSTGSTMVGGTVADIWLVHERGLPMSLFAFSALAGTGFGPVFAGWIEMNPHLQWRWIQWLHLITTGVLVVAVATLMRETRASVLLTRRAKRLRKQTGDKRYRARAEDERASLKTLIYISCTRPIYLLFTEPVVASFSLWVGFAWGILYVLIESVGLVFKTLHNFNQGQIGTVFITFVIGSGLGFVTNMYQESLYQKYVFKRGPEARLYMSMFGAILFPSAMLIYAWCTFPWVHWIALCIGTTLVIWGVFIIYLAVFVYLADCYGPFASSALAGQSLSRNLMGTFFPLFTTQMYTGLTFKWANTLFALVAVVMIPIPYVLFFKGPVIRSRSKFASQVMEKEEKVEEMTITAQKPVEMS